MSTERRNHKLDEIPGRDFHYLDLDEDSRIGFRVGELIITAAVSEGIPMPTPNDGKGDVWINCTQARALDCLRHFDQHTITGVLKAARRIVNRSEHNNDSDKDKVKQRISELIKNVGKPPKGVNPPQIPGFEIYTSE